MEMFEGGEEKLESNLDRIERILYNAGGRAIAGLESNLDRIESRMSKRPLLISGN